MFGAFDSHKLGADDGIAPLKSIPVCTSRYYGALWPIIIIHVYFVAEAILCNITVRATVHSIVVILLVTIMFYCYILLFYKTTTR